ncbi:SixA phosphatase family protein [Caldilinea sp.]|jgi:phosphohistidine phosphatase|uniref:SixA phosphatase family protein n=1 Tax=Caldilinea sp. TaxID=2293560 RepID=UPI00262308E1|nr:histidine phosphatase family protein [uncultured Caldilinea sp.]
MKYITLWRHAKAERPEHYANDFDRPLTDRGRKDAARMAALIARLDPPIDSLLSSPSARTAQTVEALLGQLNGKVKPIWQESIYLASAETLLALLQNLPEELEHVALVGHNPGMEELTSGLCGPAPETIFVRLPTAAVAHIAADVPQWNVLRWGCGQLKLLVPPKALRG